MKISHALLRLRRDDRGIAAIEFALLAPTFLLLVMGIIEFSLVMYCTSVLESAAVNSARLAKTGYTQQGITRQQMIYDMVKSRASGLMNPNNVGISAKYYSQISQINDPEPYTDSNNNHVHDASEPYTDINANGQWDADMGTAGLGGAGDIVVYTVTYPWPISTPIIRSFIGQGGIYTVTSSVVVRNEPYNTITISR